ncbi:carboxypeptidase-like regulatory domain-containing protein [Flavobacterium sp. 14A]|uniref:carboxypeptidase-like regulatory domain-containing protein n=1 Tax=Flavobacterium sp. 14A TaxID=2735896 RepID=UPI00156E96D4|nr:carboxypeptidase-like regulatory domain-containing protein [Flavobacterium sp. 14A]NRT12586.1 hypothetical protein [Flavobacterium sp. 14A]
MKKHLLTFLFSVILVQVGFAQSLRVKIIAAATGDPIPYANINVNATENLVSNGEGYFSLSETSGQDATVVIVSYLGFVNQQLTVGQLKNQELTVKMLPAMYELEDVAVSNKKITAEEIMATVQANLKINYETSEKAFKDKTFQRTTQYFNPSKIAVEINKSSGFTKAALEKVNSDIEAYAKKLIMSPPVSYTDVLSNYYSVKTKKGDKFVFNSKLDVLKATILKNEGQSTSLEDLEKKGKELMLKHLDTTKFYRFKSGIIGSRDTISFSEEFNRKANKDTLIAKQLAGAKNNLYRLMRKGNVLTNKQLDFINNPDRYTYTLEGTTFTNKNEYAYVLTFKPRKSKAKFVGKLYVSDGDFAVLRSEYALDDGERLEGFNLKLLLGIKMSMNISKGTLMFSKSSSDDKYYLQYAATEEGGYFYINRPLKLIELAKGEKDVLALDFKMETTSRTKNEYLNISHTLIDAATVTSFKEKDFKYQTISKYDPKIWQSYNAIEPLQEMKQFKTIN